MGQFDSIFHQDHPVLSVVRSYMLSNVGSSRLELTSAERREHMTTDVMCPLYERVCQSIV